MPSRSMFSTRAASARSIRMWPKGRSMSRVTVAPANRALPPLVALAVLAVFDQFFVGANWGYHRGVFKTSGALCGG